MKRAWKYTLAATGIPLLCFGGLALDAYFRAVATIDAHDARLAADRAAARIGHPPKAPDSYSFEDGHSGRDSARDSLLDESILEPQRGWSPLSILQPLELMQSHFREAGYVAARRRSSFEERELRRFQGFLTGQLLLPDQLRDLAQSFDRLRSTSPTAAEVITAEHLRDRAEVLGVLHRKRDPYGMIRRPPGWREFYSWRILIAKTLLELDDHYRQVLPLASSLSRKDEMAAGRLSETARKEEGLARTHLRSEVRDVLRIERERAADWQLTHLAMAISCFRAEVGRDPEKLAELVPDYISEVPVSLFDGRPCQIEKGTLFDMGRGTWWHSRPR